MPAGGANSKSCNQHSRTNDDAFVNRVPQCNVDKLFAANETTAEISHSRESSFDCGARISGRGDRLLGNVQVDFFQSALVVVTGEIERQMRMPIHESGRKGGVAEIDDLRIGRRRQIASGIDNLVPLNNDDAVLGQRFRFTVEKSRSFQNDDLVGRVNRNRTADKNKDCEGQPRTKSIESKDVHPGGIETSGRQSKAARWTACGLV